VAEFDRLDRDQNRALDSDLMAFRRRIVQITQRASDQVLRDLLRDIEVNAAGRIVLTTKTLNAFRNIQKTISDSFRSAGLSTAIDAWGLNYGRQITRFDQVLQSFGVDLRPSTDSIELFERLAKGSLDLLESEVGLIAQRIKRQTMLQWAVADRESIISAIARSLNLVPDQVTSLADTAISTFYRTISFNSYQKIEQQLGEQRFQYAGPRDLLNRPFCKQIWKQQAEGRTWTLTEIQGLDNGQTGNAFVTCGGYQCRHQWILAVAQPQQKAA
jgi:hypothetical protein